MQARRIAKCPRFAYNHFDHALTCHQRSPASFPVHHCWLACLLHVRCGARCATVGGTCVVKQMSMGPRYFMQARAGTPRSPPPAPTCVVKAAFQTYIEAKRSWGRGRGSQRGTWRSGAFRPSALFTKPRPPPGCA